MKLIDYLNEGKTEVGNDIVAIRYCYDGDVEGYDSDDFEITDNLFIFEELEFDLNTDGEVVDGVFQFVDIDGATIGIETLF